MQNDISNAIGYVISNPTCNTTSLGDMSCPKCAMQYMQQGLCLPGRCVTMRHLKGIPVRSFWFLSLVSSLSLVLMFLFVITNMCWLQRTGMQACSMKHSHRPVFCRHSANVLLMFCQCSGPFSADLHVGDNCVSPLVYGQKSQSMLFSLSKACRG